MQRSQFTFYESFARAMKRIKDKEDRADAYDAIVNYALYGLEPDLDRLPDSAAIAFELIRPNLDASKRKAENGKLGGRPKQTGSKSKANVKQEQAESEKEKEAEEKEEIEGEHENDCYTPSPLFPSAASNVNQVLADYLNRVNPSASPGSLDELKGFAEVMGPEVCRRAIDIALDSKKASWPYIRAILQDKQRRGVRCLADWDALGDHKKPDTKQQISTQGTDHSWMKQYIEERDRK